MAIPDGNLIFQGISHISSIQQTNFINSHFHSRALNGSTALSEINLKDEIHKGE
jgi:hypothetical protein